MAIFHSVVFVLVFLLAAVSPRAAALPLSSERNNGDIEQHELVNEHFKVYFDARSPHEGHLVLSSLERARPLLEKWFQFARRRPLPVIVSAATSGVSFANFISDAIELQTLGQGSRELYWHEFVHTMMYHSFENWLGPAGSVLHLPWLPAWFIEGLAEALTVSIGSDVQGSVERYHALTDTWPSYDQLFSLYGTGNFFVTGYSISGSFVGWLLRQKSENFLPALLKDFYRYTFPDYVLWSMVPFNGFMPFDAALGTHLQGATGRGLYEEYKKQARAHWQEVQRGSMFSADGNDKLLLENYRHLHLNADGEAAIMEKNAAVFQQRLLRFSPSTGWAIALAEESKGFVLPAKRAAPYFASWDLRRATLRATINPLTAAVSSQVVVHSRQALGKEKIIATLSGHVVGLYGSRDHVLWLEQDQEVGKFCVVNKKSFAPIDCPLRIAMPQQLSILGVRYDRSSPEEIDELWLGLSEQSAAATNYRLMRWTPAEGIKEFPYQGGGTPQQILSGSDELWLLRGENRRQGLVKLAADGSCLEQRVIEDFPRSAVLLADGSMVMELYQGRQVAYKKLRPGELPVQACTFSSGQHAPLLWAVQHQGSALPSLESALAATSPWQEEAASPRAQVTSPSSFPAAVAEKSSDSPTERAYKWRSRHIVTFPWIGSDDPRGNQLGLVSVPLMDDLQNETLRATFLYGLESRYPNSELSLQSTRWWPTLTWAISRRQLWNGSWMLAPGGNAYAFYYDELATNVSCSLPLYFWRSSLTSTVKLRSASLKSLIGPVPIAQGNINQVIGQVSYLWNGKNSVLSSSLLGKTTPEAINSTFSFSNLAGDLAYLKSISVLTRTLQASVRLEASATFVKGAKGLLLKEFYQPLRVFVPGSGSSISQSSLPLAGKGRLFSAAFGDRKGQLSSSLLYPLVQKIDTQRWLFYFKQLDFSLFYNYGGAWYQEFDKKPRSLIAATAAQINLLFENKGVKFNSGLGCGKVIGDREVQFYAVVGFDAFF